VGIKGKEKFITNFEIHCKSEVRGLILSFKILIFELCELIISFSLCVVVMVDCVVVIFTIEINDVVLSMMSLKLLRSC
jgi:hypothetical protein